MSERLIGKTKGGNNTKIHAIVNDKGLPLKILLSKGNVNDISMAKELVKGYEHKTIIADKCYDASIV